MAQLTNPSLLFTAEDLKAKGYPGSASGDIYAIFEVEADSIFREQRWDGVKLQSVLKDFESRRKYREVGNLGRSSAIPRVLTLQELLKAVR